MKSVVQLMSVLVPFVLVLFSGSDATGSGSGMTINEDSFSITLIAGSTTVGASASSLTGISAAAVSSTPPVVSSTFSIMVSRIDSSSTVPSVTIALSSTDSFSVSSYSTSTTSNAMLMPLTTLFVYTTTASSPSPSPSPPALSLTTSRSPQATTSVISTPVISSSSSVSSLLSIAQVSTATPSFLNNSTVVLLLSPSISPSPSTSTSVPPPSPSPSTSTSTSTSVPPPSISPSPSTSVPPPSISPSPSTSVPPPLPVAIIAGAAGGGFCIVVCIIFVICLVCCIRKRGRYELKTAGKDGTTLAREYQLETYGDFKDGATRTKFEEVTTTDTFGIKSPVEVNVGGQKFTFPDLPNDADENFPALIFLNPVKPDEIATSNTYASRSSTLPTRKKNKILTTEATSTTTDAELFDGQMKLSKSTSEINKDADPITQPKLPAHIEVLFSPERNTLPVDSPVYDTPRTFKPLKSSHNKDKKSADSSPNAEYVTMEPLPKKENSSIVSSALQQPPVATKASVGVDRLAPKQMTESIYDNPRLMKSKPLVAEKALPVNSTAAPSIYDVPRKLLLVAESHPSTKETNTQPPMSAVVVTQSKIAEAGDSVYDIPKTSSKTSVEKGVTKLLENLQPNQTKSENATVKPPQLLPKPTDGTKVAEIAKPSISPKPKPSIVGANSETGSTKPLILPKLDSVKTSIDATDTSKEEIQADRSNKPLIPSKPNSAKASTTEKLTVSEKPALKPRVSPKPGPKPNEQEKSVTPPFESANDKGKEGESSSDNGTPEPMANSEQESVEGFPIPKPRAKPRKATKRQIGMPQNLMQELFARQSSQSKLADKSPPPSKPPVKPKPNVK